MELDERTLNRGKSKGDETSPSTHGVDVTLIRWMLSLTPGERLRVLQRNVACIIRLRNARNRT